MPNTRRENRGVGRKGCAFGGGGDAFGAEVGVLEEEFVNVVEAAVVGHCEAEASVAGRTKAFDWGPARTSEA